MSVEYWGMFIGMAVSLAFITAHIVLIRERLIRIERKLDRFEVLREKYNAK